MYLFLNGKARGHLVAQVDPLKMSYADLHGRYRDRKGEASKTVVRDYMLGTTHLRTYYFTTF